MENEGYGKVKSRIKEIEGISPPQFSFVEDIDINKIENYLKEIFEKTNFNDGFSADKESLFEHLEVMKNYFKVLMDYPDFSDLAKKVFPEKTEELLEILVYLHDYSRFIFNGPLPLVYVDWVSGGLLKKRVLNQMFSNNPEVVDRLLNCFHSIDWITGKKPLPDDDSQLTNEQKIGLILKVVDTLGKRESDGSLRDPDEFFSENGGYNRWLRFQIEKNRFPLKIAHNQFIDAQTYAQNDIALTRRGIGLIEGLTRESFAVIKNKAQEMS